MTAQSKSLITRFLRPANNGEPPEMTASRELTASLLKLGASSTFWNCSGTMNVWVTPYFSTASIHDSGVNASWITQVPPTISAQNIDAQAILEYSPIGQIETASKW